MCFFYCGYHDIHFCYYGRQIVNFNKTQTVRIIKFYHIQIWFLPFLQMLLFLIMNINVHLHPNSGYLYCKFKLLSNAHF